MITMRCSDGVETELPVDIRAELAEHEWTSVTWTDNKLVAASPFRYERHPSFAVILEHGGWRDYGATDSDWQSGSFVRLLSFLRRETVEETAEYLAVKYGDNADGSDADITLKVPKLLADKPKVYRIGNDASEADILDQYRWRSPYLGRRGITEPVQQLMRIGYDKRTKAVTIPWFNLDGSLGNVKYRKVSGKAFWYAKNARPIREMLYGINIVYGRRITKVAIVEGEVDALTLMTHGIFAIATGGTAFTAAKAELILRSPIEELTIYRDNDGPGRAWRNRIVDELAGKIDVRLALVPARFGKDVNEAVMNGWDVCSGRSRKCRNISINLR
ncbi:toprim domain-containing protein [Paenibacillus sp. J5C_2022]|uniref:toprim domain-containing protein n=1 Tax=Paenibacillus sp. J5C2022 TaxID=2977129 RepID=UPI0021CF3D2E|nr:toprim domain-containing protein [Paenibacillus sp. J5C2022]MCU6709302.1 toprim domain-containing protein [Paenibacillus sp. J5C2022]